MNKRHYEHTLPNIRGSLSNTYFISVFQSFYIFVLAVRPDLPAYCSAKVTDNSCTLQILTACGGRRKSSFSGRSVFLSPDLSGCRYHFCGAEK